jgi:hypothetical protein
MLAQEPPPKFDVPGQTCSTVTGRSHSSAAGIGRIGASPQRNLRAAFRDVFSARDIKRLARHTAPAREPGNAEGANLTSGRKTGVTASIAARGVIAAERVAAGAWRASPALRAQ